MAKVHKEYCANLRVNSTRKICSDVYDICVVLILRYLKKYKISTQKHYTQFDDVTYELTSGVNKTILILAYSIESVNYWAAFEDSAPMSAINFIIKPN